LAEFTNRNVEALVPAVQTLAAGPMYELLHQEPAFQSYSRSSNHSNDGLTWSFSLADGIRRYRTVTSIDSYIDAVNAHLAEVNADLPAALTTTAPLAPSRWKRAGAGVLSFVKGRLQALAVSTVDKVLASLAGGAAVALVTWLTVLKDHR
jgi:tagatose-1,6-bisphosphate aldolase non-catalytic subunit AgaZ/GatZ